MAWTDCNNIRPHISLASSKWQLEDEVEWFELSLSKLLDKYAKILYITPFSKR